ncbi:MAG: UvrD-helicase domain-containing protein [Elusimicrobiota bacterium]
MSKINLSPKQQEIVDFGQGVILVKASAGSGKTRVLTERIKRLLDTTKRKILAITFTNKAGEEMKERLGNLADIKNRLFIGTFHGFCQQVLENHGQLIGFTNIPHIFEDESDRLELIEQAIEKTPSYYSEYVKQNPKQQRDFRYRALNFISEVKRKLLSGDELLKESDDADIVLLYTTYQDILDSQNAIDFDDLISLTYNLFIANPKIAALYRRTYEYICIDEAQDLNYAQYQLLRSVTIGEHRNVMMVGDPNQSIFAFNGSSSEYMTKMFVEDYQPEIIELKENYRSSKSVLQAAQKIIPDSCEVINTYYPGIFEIHKMDDE